MPGLVSLVGVGPGDPSLLTLRGQRVLHLADVVLYDALVHPRVLDHARPDAERLDVGKRYGLPESVTQDEINHMLLLRARQGRHVARLKGGDPLFFARGAEEALFLASHGVAFEIIPGVPSPIAVAAYAGIPLTHRDLASSIAVITGTEHPGKTRSAHDWERLATATQTLVIVMGMHTLAATMDTLVAHGRPASTPAAVVQWGTLPTQRVVTGTVADIAARCHDAHVTAPAVVIVGDVARLRDTLRWWDARPLFARRVVVTRARDQSRSMIEALLDAGAHPIEAPVLRFDDPADPAPLQSAIDDLVAGQYHLVAFTSTNGVHRFLAALARRDLDARAFARARIAAIGPATRDALLAHGLRADTTAQEFRGEGVAAAITDLLGPALASARVLIPRAEQARDALPAALSAAGARTDVVPVYRTLPPDPDALAALRDELAAGHVDVVTFTSSSTVQHLCDALGADAAALLATTLVASIGPVTSETARARGLTVTVEAREYTVPGLLDALARHFQNTPPNPTSPP